MQVREPLFAGLIIDEYDNPVDTTLIGDEPCYVVDDSGFRRHIPAVEVDRQVLEQIGELIKGNEDILSKQTAEMLGADDIFSQAMLQNQLKNLDEQFEKVLDAGIPEEGRAYLGMAGFQVRINLHGEVLEVKQPGMIDPDDE